ncbi:HOAR [Spodoptera littoralis nucleopolyhedrovirus]|uniref:HOAR n=1 Tax=Spodoptera littoralis nuclear polyhedrosis virus TaxID=10456 RepID=M1J423_NPVSL|nr:HOAR [Spodoptera littoralis nucleopolyhedrovirus]AGE89859.1 HOAR [Spodoptera littoralis nucleopolyhedrovirus]
MMSNYYIAFEESKSMQCINVFLVPATNKVQQRNNRVGHLDLQSNTFRFNVTKTQYNVYSDALVQFKQNMCRVPFDVKLNKKLNDLLTDMTRFKLVEILLVKMDELLRSHERTTYDDSEYYRLVRKFLQIVETAQSHKEITIAATELGITLMEKCKYQNLNFYTNFLCSESIHNEVYIMKDKLRPAILNARQVLEAKINLSINELKSVIILYQLRVDAILCESCNEKSASQLMTCGHRFCVDCIYEKIVEEIKEHVNYSCIICEKMNYFVSLNVGPMNEFMSDFYNQLRGATNNAAKKIGILADDVDDSGVATAASDSSSAVSTKAKSRKRSASTATAKSLKSRKLSRSIPITPAIVYSSDDDDDDDDKVRPDTISVVNIDKLKSNTNCSVQLNSDESTDYDADDDDNIPPNQEAFNNTEKSPPESAAESEPPQIAPVFEPFEYLDYLPDYEPPPTLQPEPETSETHEAAESESTTEPESATEPETLHEAESESTTTEPPPQAESESATEPPPPPQSESSSQSDEPLRYDDSCVVPYKEPVVVDDNDVVIKKEIISDPDVIDQYYKTKFDQTVTINNDDDDDDDDDDIEFVSCKDKDGKDMDVRDIKLHKGFECLYRLPGTNEFQSIIMEKVMIKDENNGTNGVPALFDSIDRYMCQARNIHYTRRIERRRGIDENIIMNELQRKQQPASPQPPSTSAASPQPKPPSTSTPPQPPSPQPPSTSAASPQPKPKQPKPRQPKPAGAASSISKSKSTIAASSISKSKSKSKYRQATISECNTTRLYPDGKVKFLTQ